MDKVREAAGSSRATKEKQPESDAPALWPLIRQVNVRCRAAALSTGAVLVDLPGISPLYHLDFELTGGRCGGCKCG